MSQPSPPPQCSLALEDGTVFTGRAFGARGTRTGEVVFNTAMTGYQEVLTDPSYFGQIVAMTAVQMGNYGINREDVEAARPWVSGFVMKEPARRPSNCRATLSLEEYLIENDVIGLCEIDTRALTMRLRVTGAMRGVLSTEITDPAECVRLAQSAPLMTGADLVSRVAPAAASVWKDGLDSRFLPPRHSEPGKWRVVAIDCGMKRNILRHLVDIGCEVQIVPPTFTAEQILGYQPDGLFISNGPGDPAAVDYTIKTLQKLLGKLPIFGICLGHQLLGLAMGAQSFKLKFGHRGANQPVRNLHTGRVEITSQNHGFAIETRSLEASGGVTTHLNLNDGTLEGFVHRDWPVLAVQYHPEASPGPHDAAYLFDCFATMMTTGRPPTPQDMSQAQRSLQNRMQPAHEKGRSI